MSHFGQLMKVGRKVVVTFWGTKYTTVGGLVGSLAEDVAQRVISRMNDQKKYGYPDYTKKKSGVPPMTNLERWNMHKARLRKKFIRRAKPIIERVFRSV